MLLRCSFYISAIENRMVGEAEICEYAKHGTGEKCSLKTERGRLPVSVCSSVTCYFMYIKMLLVMINYVVRFEQSVHVHVVFPLVRTTVRCSRTLVRRHVMKGAHEQAGNIKKAFKPHLYISYPCISVNKTGAFMQNPTICLSGAVRVD